MVDSITDKYIKRIYQNVISQENDIKNSIAAEEAIYWYLQQVVLI